MINIVWEGISKDKNYGGDTMGKKYDYSYTQDRELSWLKFNERVLKEAGKKENPFLERLKFLEIFTNNLDEFYMVRVGSIHEMSMIHDDHRDIRSNFTPEEQLEKIAQKVRPLYKLRDSIFKDVSQTLEKEGIERCTYEQLTKEEKKYLKDYFEVMIQPILSPIVMGKQHPFPHIPNKVLQIGLMLKKKDKNYFAIISVPKDLDSIIFLSKEKQRFILLEEVILEFCDSLFENYTILEKCVLSVTRSADINPDDEIYETTDDYREHMKKIIKMRSRLEPVRLEVYGKEHRLIEKYLMDRLKLCPQDIFQSETPLIMKYVYDLTDRIPEAKKKAGSYVPFSPAVNRDITPGESVTKQVLEGDKLLSFPFETMDTFVELLKESARDKETISIKITIYRLAKQAKIVKYLCEAAENGKEVLVLMELRARFDEENNINYSEILEEAGCKVMYGMEEYKVHSKVCLITKKNGKGVYYITQIGTGNYNESTSKIYTDLSLLTSSMEIGQDAARFFQNMSTYNLNGQYKHLLVAPAGLKENITKYIYREKMKADSFQPSGIFMKMNSLTDRQIIDALSEASSSGVPVFLLIRGICCIRPGIPGKTENIHVESIVGRFLEHSRIYSFGVGDDMKIYLSSADMMTRNTKRRVEIACPVYDPKIQKRIKEMMMILRKDNVLATRLESSGEYVKKDKKEEIINSQQYFLEESKEHQRKVPKRRKGFFGAVGRYFRKI
ncbi:polyphosphate kinase 1 [Anaerostipes sp.]|uniref:polyphosphate kinase 1 n=1 Tax=Anaerostipes sp. TaxID=1872530 RepID=UPI00258B26AE|nr:polyphosphate kinase 1 [Anaerostipes sp.]MCI5623119.1 polyphosphate kinase 1 [Anaerostipes sp.]MDY2726763.1 polyphosphate kinase 1 [Anaerostipes faecalis]